MLADLTSRSALVLPTSPDGSGLVPFEPGTHRITFHIDRPQYDITDPADPVSRYQLTASFDITI